MTTDYDQHVRYADDETDRARGQLGDDGPANGIIFATLAVAEATLAAAEQARIGNLIAVARYNTVEQHRAREHGLTPTVDQMARLSDLQEVIREALGLPAPKAEQSSPPLRNPPAPEPEEGFDDGLTEPERVDIERLTIGVFQPLTGAHLAYRIWWLGDIASDEAEDAETRLLAAKELGLYAPEEKTE